MRKFFKRLKRSGMDDEDDVNAEEEFLELNADAKERGFDKVLIRPFNLTDFADVKPILDCIRMGNAIALVNIKPLKEKDLVELKRAINKLKKTIEAIDGDIAGFGDDYIVLAPSFAQIYRGSTTTIDEG
ncbi:MAG: cell division protein SepF [Nanoarchaeota archaeon]